MNKKNMGSISTSGGVMNYYYINILISLLWYQDKHAQRRVLPLNTQCLEIRQRENRSVLTLGSVRIQHEAEK